MSGTDGPTRLQTTATDEAAAFFDAPMYVVDVAGWPSESIHPPQPITTPLNAPDGARLRIHAIHPHDRRALPPGDGAPDLVEIPRFTLNNSGNRTLQAPKRSWKVQLEDDAEIAGMDCLNLKAMYNDPSQMREALAWRFFAQAAVPASRHTYARFGINGTYLGLFSLIEQVDKHFLTRRFGDRNKGTLFKVYCGDLGPGTLEHRSGPDGDDSGRQYRSDGDDPTYRVKSFSTVDGAEDYDDLARFVRVINGLSVSATPAEATFASDAFANAVHEIFDVGAFLRWAAVNVLVGGWDNYYATPANYYLYNSGTTAGSRDVLTNPYFTWIPWDYDNTFGIDYFGTQWQYTDLLDWPANTERYWGHGGRGAGTRSRLPLLTNLLRNGQFRRYYLDAVEHLLDTAFTPRDVDAAIGITDPTGGTPAVAPSGGGLFDRVAQSAYLESQTPWGWAPTGRQYTNDEVYRAGFQQQELRHGETFVLGIHHYLRMRYDSAREQLAVLRRTDPAGSSGATFPNPVFPGAAFPADGSLTEGGVAGLRRPA